VSLVRTRFSGPNPIDDRRGFRQRPRRICEARADKRIKILRFNDELIKVFGKLSKEVLADTAAKDPLTRKVCDSYLAFLAGIMDWGELSETGYRDTRRLALA
jgi:TRAP-type mannitol/chloroaromatic compound transport system substrate-binding protein